MTIKIEHTITDGTIVTGTEQGDGTNEALKAGGFRWSRNLGAWYLPHSRNKTANQAKIDALAAGLTAAGHEVETVVDNDVSGYDPAVVEAGRVERDAARAERFGARAERLAAASDAAYERSNAAVAGIEPGQPILVGHHSQARHENALKRSWDQLGKSVELQDAADEAAHRAASSRAATGARNSPITVGNRIGRLRAEVARLERLIDAPVYESRDGGLLRAPTVAERESRAEHFAAELGVARADLDHWEAVRAAQIESGEVVEYGPANVAKGDLVRIGGSWHVVARANRKTVAVETGHSWTDRAPWHKVTGHKAKGEGK